MKYIHIPVAGTPRIVECGIEESYRTLARLIGGPLEAVGIDDHTLYVNEEGKLLGLPYNVAATEVAGSNLLSWDTIVGDAVLAGPVDEEGWDTDVAQAWIDRLIS